MINETPHNSIDTEDNLSFTRLSARNLYKHTPTATMENLQRYIVAQHNLTARELNIRLEKEGKEPIHYEWKGKPIDNICRNLLLIKSVIEN